MPLGRQILVLLVAAALAWAGTLTPVEAQQLAPRAYWPAPLGTKVVSFGVAYQQGEVVVDPALPIEDAEGSLTSVQVGYLQVVSLFGRTASLGLVIPRSEGRVTGVLDETFSRREVQGFADASLTLGLNFLGAPSMAPEEFRLFRRDPKPILGMSLEVRLPLGQYDSAQLVNLGTNRWAVKPELGYIHALGSGYLFEANIGGWIYGENDDFLGEPRKQDSLLSLELHLVRRQKGAFWTSLDLTFYHGGRTEVGGDRNDDRLSNVRAGATIVFPRGNGQAFRAAASTSLRTANGGSYDSYLFAYSRAWR